jgi:hypothetical protein
MLSPLRPWRLFLAICPLQFFTFRMLALVELRFLVFYSLVGSFDGSQYR